MAGSCSRRRCLAHTLHTYGRQHRYLLTPSAVVCKQLPVHTCSTFGGCRQAKLHACRPTRQQPLSLSHVRRMGEQPTPAGGPLQGPPPPQTSPGAGRYRCSPHGTTTRHNSRGSCCSQVIALPSLGFLYLTDVLGKVLVSLLSFV